MWNGTEVKHVGTCAQSTKRFLVVKESLTLLLGLNATEKIGLLTVHKENFVSVVENLENDLLTNTEMYLIVALASYTWKGSSASRSGLSTSDSPS